MDNTNDSVNFLKSKRKDVNEFSTLKYNTTALSYPIDLMETSPNGLNQYGSNYVIFFINVSEESKIIKEGKVAVAPGDFSKRNRGLLAGRNAQNNTTVGKVAATAAAVGAISDIAAATIGINIGGAGTKSGVIGAAALGLAGDELGSFTRPQKRLQSAIALHVPNQLGIRYGINWQDEDASLFTYGVTAATEMQKMLKSMTSHGLNVDAIKADLGKQGKSSLSIAQQILAANVLNASSGVSASTGLAKNPNREQIFQGVDFRTFQFDYQFFPRSKDEADNVLNIIQQFKYHMHPEYKDPNNFIYIYPSEFDIEFYQGSKQSKAIHKLASSVLTNITVNYTPNAMFNAFEDGTPTQINVVMEFRELTQLSKSDIAEGY